jgi:hypothetical protein
MTCPADRGGPATNLGGHWHGCLKAVCMVGHCCDPPRHWPMPSRTPQRNSAASSPITPSAPRRPNFAQPRAAVEDRRPTSPPRRLRGVPGMTRRGANNAARRLQLRMMAASRSEQVASVESASWRLQTTSSIGRGHPWTILRRSLQGLARATPTPSSPSSWTTT